MDADQHIARAEALLVSADKVGARAAEARTMAEMAQAHAAIAAALNTTASADRIVQSQYDAVQSFLDVAPVAP